MNQTDTATASAPSNAGRRMVLGGLLSMYAASLVPWALAEPVADADQGPFLALSAILVGRQSLDKVQAKRLFDALKAEDAGFPASAKALLDLINQRSIAPIQLQAALDDEKSPLAPLPRKIVSAWYLGIVGSGATARALAYENALNAVVVSDVLKPPTYAYGPYGSWAKKPI